MGCRSTIVVGALLCACAGADATVPCAERTSFRDRADLYHIAGLPNGYVLDDRDMLVGFGLDDVERFEIAGSFRHFAAARDGQLVTVSDEGGILVVEAWSPDGSALGELGRIEDAQGPLELRGATILADGSVLAHGGGWREFWTARVSPGGSGMVTRSDQEQRRGAVAALGNEAYVLRATWYDEEGTYERLELSRVGADETPRWTTTVFDRPDDSVPHEVLGGFASAGDDAFVVTRPLYGDPTVATVRRYAPDGELLWTRTEDDAGHSSAGLPIVRTDGSLLWVDGRADAIRVRFLDDAGTIVCEQEVEGDGQAVSDLAIIDDELFVITVDRITRIRLGHPSTADSAA